MSGLVDWFINYKIYSHFKKKRDAKREKLEKLEKVEEKKEKVIS